MSPETEVIDLISEFNKNSRQSTFAEFIATLYKDKFVELYLGDSYEELKLEQTSTTYPAVFCGKVVAAFKECLVLSTLSINKLRIKSIGGLVFINERAIRALTEVDGHGILEDMFIRSSESLEVKDIYDDMAKGKTVKRK